MTDENTPWLGHDETVRSPLVSDAETSSDAAPVPAEQPSAAPGWLSESEPAPRHDEAASGEQASQPTPEAEAETTPDSSEPTAQPTERLDEAALAAATVPAAGGDEGADESGGEEPDPLAGIVSREPDMGPERGSQVWAWVVIGLSVVTIVGALGYAWWWRSARPIEVPDLTGRQPAEATQLLNDMLLTLGSVSEAPTDTVAAGTVVSQKPRAGATLSPGGQVAFVVAIAPDQAKVPDLGNRTRESAEAALAAARLRPRVVETFSSSTGDGIVITQLPESGTALPAGTQVVLVVSRGPVPYTATVPRLSGLIESEANKLLAANSLSALYYRSFDTSIPAGDIIAQSPLARTTAPWGSLVQVLVSQGPGTTSVTVPNVTGESRKSAESALKSRKLKPVVRSVPSETVASGRVVSQMPPAGRAVASGIDVGILVSSGPVSSATVPTLVGAGSINVTETITAAGLKPIVLTVAADGNTPGSVFAQYPEAGTAHPRGFPVIALIAAPKP